MVQSFLKLRLSRPQQVLLAATWQMWVRNRRSQDGRLRAILHPLGSLLNENHIITPWQPHPHGGAAAAAGSACGDGHGACCVCPACAHRLSKRLLGVSMKAHAHAAQAARQLRAFQEHDSASVAAVVNAVRMPGAFLSAEQVAAQMHVSIEAKVPVADWLQLCQMADADLKQRDVFQGL